MALNIPELIRRKREGGEIAPAELKEFIDGYVAEEVESYQVSAFLMAVFFKGMTPAEAAALTRSMLESGDRYNLSDIPGPKVDKHSTGGVGDKLSLVLAPLVAAAGGIVPMVSGRGLGHTGGTLDKLDSIPGYRWNLDAKQFKAQLGKVGCAIIGQTDSFVPADKKLYALRDVTATVESVPLICASILSKKVAAGTDSLVMDVKCGSGAFMDNIDRARELANGLVSIGTALGRKVSAMITQMSQPLGTTIGNALEVHESIELLKGGGPRDSRHVTLELCAEMLVLAGLKPNRADARMQLEQLLDSGKALEKFVEWIEAQGGDARIVDNPNLAEISKKVKEVRLPHGTIAAINTRQLGVAANTLGAGRIKTSDVVDTRVGMICPFKVGDVVDGESAPILLYHADRNVEQVEQMVREAFTIFEGAAGVPLPLILEEIHPE